MAKDCNQLLPDCAAAFARNDEAHDSLVRDFKGVKESQARIEKAIIGNGEPGMRIDLDRLKQKEKARQWTLRAFLLALLTLAGKALYDAFKQ